MRGARRVPSRRGRPAQLRPQAGAYDAMGRLAHEDCGECAMRFTPASTVRALRLHDRGRRVERLQSRLAAWGYDPGPIDGRFGFATLEALLQFQRENRLRADGRAGPQVWSLLALDRRPRLSHVVGAESRWSEVAHLLGVSTEALRRNNLRLGRKPVRGRRVHVPLREVYAGLDPAAAKAAFRRLERSRRLLSGIVVPACRVGPDGALEWSWDEAAERFAAELGVELACLIRCSGGRVRGALSRKARAALLRAVEGAPRVAQAIWIELPRPAWGEGRRYTALLRQTAEAIRRRKMRATAVVPLPPARRSGLWFYDVNYRRIAASFDRVAAAPHLHRPLPLSGPETMKRIGALTAQVPGHKCLLGIPAGAWLRAERGDGGEEGPQEPLRYDHALAEAYRSEGRPAREPADGRLRSRIEVDGRSHEAWIEDASSGIGRLQAVDRFNLAGAYIWPCGKEDPRLWEGLGRRLKVCPPP